MDYGELFSKAWKIIKRFKVLWIFGFLASCGAASGGGGGNTGYQFNSGDGGKSAQFFNERMPHFFERWSSLPAITEEQVGLWIVIAVIVLIVVGLFVGLLTLVLRTIGRGGLVRGTWDADEGSSKLTFRTLWQSGVKNFWKVLLFTLLLWGINLVLGIVLILPIIFFSIVTLLCGLIVIIPILIALSWMITAWYQLGLVAIVGDNLGVMDAFSRSWNVVMKNFWRVLLVSLIVFVGTFIVVLFLMLPFLLTVLPVIIAIALEAQVLTAWIVISAVLFLVYLVIVIILGAGIQAYQGAVWTLLYRRLTDRMGKDVGSSEPLEPFDLFEEKEIEKLPEQPKPREVLPGEPRKVAKKTKTLPDADKPA